MIIVVFRYVVIVVIVIIVGVNGIYIIGVVVGGIWMVFCCIFVDILIMWFWVGLSEIRFVMVKVGVYCVGIFWVWWIVVWFNRIFVNINISVGFLVFLIC